MKTHSVVKSNLKKIKRTMKKSIILGLMLSVLALTNCTKNEEFTTTPEVSTPFTLFADVDTRTTNDGLNTEWAADDAINVFHAVTETTTYKNDGQFTIAEADLATSRFSGTLNGTLDEASYDWYAFYPYSEFISTPANNSYGYSIVGHDNRYSLTQNGYNSKAHLAGVACPLAGIATDVAAGTTPQIAMHHLSSVVKFVVTNSLTEAITISQITLESNNHNIIGSYFINFASYPEVVYTDKYPAKKAILDVQNGTALAAGAKAEFYLPIKPCEMVADDTLTIVVSASSESGVGTDTGLITLTKATEFVAGNIKPINVNYDTAFEVAEDETWSLITDPSQIVEGTYVIVAHNKSSYGYVPNTAATVQNVAYKTTTLFDGTTTSVTTNQVPDDARWSFTGTSAALTISNGSSLYLASENANNGMKVSSTVGTWAASLNSEVGGAAMNLQYSTTSRYLAAYNESNWRCYTRIYNYSAAQDQSGAIYLYYCGTIVYKPVINANDPVAVAADVTTITIPYTVSNSVGGKELQVTENVDWVTAVAVDAENGKVILTITANESEEPRNATITLSYEGATDKVVTISQEGVYVAPEPGDYSTTNTSGDGLLTAEGGTSTSNTSVQINSSNYDAVKAGTKNVSGACLITVPAGTTKLHVHAAAWKDSSVTLSIEGATCSPDSIDLIADSGVTGNGNFTLVGKPEIYYHELELSDITTETTLTFTATSGRRFVIWGVNAE